MGRPAPRPLGEGETLNESTAATKTIKLHTACAPLHVLDFRPDPTTWKKNMGARIIVRSQQNPELAFDRGIEMTATACGAFEVDAKRWRRETSLRLRCTRRMDRTDQHLGKMQGA